MAEKIRVELEMDASKGTIVLRDFDRDLTQTVSTAGRSGGAADRAGRNFEQMGRQIDGAGRRAAASGALFRQMASTLGVAFSARAVISWGQATHEAHSTFQRDLNMVSTMLSRNQLGQQRYTQVLTQYRDRLQDLSVEFGESTSTLSKGLYDILSASVAPSKALDVLATSSRAARAGFTDTAVAVDFITSALNAYGRSADQAGNISDIAFATVGRGKTTFAELAGSIGQVAPTAAAAGISLEQLMAMLANVTRQGVNTNEAVTAINALIVQFSRGSKEASQAWDGLRQRLGLARAEFGVARLQNEELFETLEVLAQATDKERIAILQEVRALKAANAMAQDSKGLREDLSRVLNAQGETLEALSKREKESELITKQLEQAYERLATTLGDKTAPAINAFKLALKTGLDILNTHIDEGTYGELIERLLTGTTRPQGLVDLDHQIKTLSAELKEYDEGALNFIGRRLPRADFLRERIAALKAMRDEMVQLDALGKQASSWASAWEGLDDFTLPTIKGGDGGGAGAAPKKGLTGQEKAQAAINAATASQQQEYFKIVAASVEMETELRRAGMDEHERGLDKIREKYEATYQKIDDLILAGVYTEEQASGLKQDFITQEGLAVLEAERKKSEALGRSALERQRINEQAFSHEKSLLDEMAEAYGNTYQVVKDTSFQTAREIQGGFNTLFSKTLRGDINDFNDFLGVAGDVGINIISNVGSQMATGFLMKGISPMIGGIGDWLTSLLGSSQAAGTGFLSIMGPYGWAIAGGIAGLTLLITNWDDVSETLGEIFEGIGDAFQGIMDGMVEAASSATDSITGIFDGIGDIFDFGDIGDSVGDAVGDIFDFDFFHQGGRVMHQGGAVRPVIAHAGMLLGRPLGPREIPVIAEEDEYITRRSSVNPETLPTLEHINRTGQAPGHNITVPISIPGGGGMSGEQVMDIIVDNLQANRRGYANRINAALAASGAGLMT